MVWQFFERDPRRVDCIPICAQVQSISLYLFSYVVYIIMPVRDYFMCYDITNVRITMHRNTVQVLEDRAAIQGLSRDYLVPPIALHLIYYDLST